MTDTPVNRVALGAKTVHEDWQAWLPSEKGDLFEAAYDELDVSYVMLSVALDDAFVSCEQGRLQPAREQAGVFADLFDRLAGGLHGVLQCLQEHGRHFGTYPRVTSLRAEPFRSDSAQMVAHANYLLSMVSLRKHSRFFRKLATLDELISKLQKQCREIAQGILEGATVSLPERWSRLEVLHYDMNTCFCETTIILKSFFCVLPGVELPTFRKGLISFLPASAAVRPRRCPVFVTKTGPVGDGHVAPIANRATLAGEAKNPNEQQRPQRLD